MGQARHIEIEVIRPDTIAMAVCVSTVSLFIVILIIIAFFLLSFACANFWGFLFLFLFLFLFFRLRCVVSGVLWAWFILFLSYCRAKTLCVMLLFYFFGLIVFLSVRSEVWFVVFCFFFFWFFFFFGFFFFSYHSYCPLTVSLCLVRWRAVHARAVRHRHQAVGKAGRVVQPRTRNV